MEWLTSTLKNPDILASAAAAECDLSSGTARILARIGPNLRSAKVTATAIFQYIFEVKTVPGSDPSVLPIHVALPNRWGFALFNAYLLEFLGNATLDVSLQLRVDPGLGIDNRGALLAKRDILSATHGGLAGCVSIPTGTTALATLTARCLLSLANFF